MPIPSCKISLFKSYFWSTNECWLSLWLSTKFNNPWPAVYAKTNGYSLCKNFAVFWTNAPNDAPFLYAKFLLANLNLAIGKTPRKAPIIHKFASHRLATFTRLIACLRALISYTFAHGQQKFYRGPRARGKFSHGEFWPRLSMTRRIVVRERQGSSQPEPLCNLIVKLDAWS